MESETNLPTFCGRDVQDLERDVGYEGDTDDVSNQLQEDKKKANYSIRRSDKHQLSPLLGMYTAEIREGDQYQCDESSMSILNVYSEADAGSASEEREDCVWEPRDDLDEKELLSYLSAALVRGIGQDRAMFILMNSDYDIALARKELAKRFIFKEPWSSSDIGRFKQCCRTYGKRFDKFKEVLSNKSIAEIIEFYYNNKKLMKFRNLFEQASDASDSEDDKVKSVPEPNTGTTGDCDNCGAEDVNLYSASEMELCADCNLHLATFKTQRPCAKFFTKVHINCKTRCPPDMEEKVKNFAEFAAFDEEEFEALSTENDDDDIQVVVAKKRISERKLREMKKEVLALRSKCLRLEHDVRLFYKQHLSDGIDRFRVPCESQETRRPRSTRIWETKEKYFAFYALQRYGKDFDAIAALIGTKTPNDIRCLYNKFAKQIDEAYAAREAKLKEKLDEYDFDSLFKSKDLDFEVVDID